MAKDERRASIKNVAETPWRQFPNHFGGALSKPLVMPETMKSKHSTTAFRCISRWPMWRSIVIRCRSRSTTCIEGEGLMEVGDKTHIVRKHDVIYLPPGVEHSINNTGVADLVFIVATSPVTDDPV